MHSFEDEVTSATQLSLNAINSLVNIKRINSVTLSHKYKGTKPWPDTDKTSRLSFEDTSFCFGPPCLNIYS